MQLVQSVYALGVPLGPIKLQELKPPLRRRDNLKFTETPDNRAFSIQQLRLVARLIQGNVIAIPAY